MLEAGGLVALAFHVGDEVMHREQWWDMPVVLDARFLQPDGVGPMLTAAGLEVVSVQERDPYAPDVEFQCRRAYVVAQRLVEVPGNRKPLPPMGLGYPRTDLRRRLVDAALRGDKVATAGLALDFAPHTPEPLPKAGDRWALLGFDDEPVAVVESTDVRLVPAGQVDLQFARDEGEGFETIADWRAAHERFWSDRDITDETVIVCEHFRIVERFA